MLDDTSTEERIAKLKKDIEILTEQLKVLKAQRELDTEKQTQETLLVKATLDALKEQTASQAALNTAQAQLPFAQLQGIKAGIEGLTLPQGKEGTITVAAGTADTALLRSKQAMLELLVKVADQLVTLCPDGAVLATEAQLDQAYAARTTLARIDAETKALMQAIEDASPVPEIIEDASPPIAASAAPILPAIAAGAYGLGFTLDTINSLAKLLRANRQLNVFSADAEALQMLGYILDSKQKGFVVNPDRLDDRVDAHAQTLLNNLKVLGKQVSDANILLSKLKKTADDIAKAPANDPIKKKPMPTDEQINSLKAETDAATSLLDGLHPAKKPDAFWAQVKGQFLAENMKNKPRLLLEAKAQTVQITDSRWWRSDRIFATGEVQIAYRLLTASGALVKSGILLMASPASKRRIDKLAELTWQLPDASRSHS